MNSAQNEFFVKKQAGEKIVSMNITDQLDE